jgi:hypothetical protein
MDGLFHFKPFMKKAILAICCVCLLSRVVLAQAVNFKPSNEKTKIDDTSTKVGIVVGDDTKNVFETLDIIEYRRVALKRADKEKELATSLGKLKATDGTKLSDAAFKLEKANYRAIEKAIGIIKATQDSLYYLYVKDYVNFKRCMVLNFGALRSRAFFDLMYDNEGKIVKVLNNSGINFASNTAALYSELASGSIGAIRASLGAMVVSSSDDEVEQSQEEAYQRLATSGGNTVLKLEYPLAYIHSRNRQFNFLSRLLARGSADFAAFGTTTDKVAGSASYGIDFYGDAATENNALRFFFNFNFHRIKGTESYKENLGVNSSAFNYGQLVLGLVFVERFKISFIVNTVSSEKALRNSRLIGGGEVLH